MWVIDELLDLLQDGEWHDLQAIARNTALDPAAAQAITDLLFTYDFIKFDKTTQKVKLSPVTLEFVHEIQCIEEDEDISALRSR